MVREIDARDLPCPQPVLVTKKALEAMAGGMLQVIVDNKAAMENVRRFAVNADCETSVREEGRDFIIEIKKGSPKTAGEETAGTDTVVVIASDRIGKGNDELGGILMRILFPTLLEINPKPKTLVFVNAGVKMTVEGSDLIDPLTKLEKHGVELLVCGTCLDFFGLKEKVRIGKVSNFFEIMQTILRADKTIGL